MGWNVEARAQDCGRLRGIRGLLIGVGRISRNLTLVEELWSAGVKLGGGEIVEYVGLEPWGYKA